MVLTTIYLTRHGFRANWESGPLRPHRSGQIPPDTPLSQYGEEQSCQLASHLVKLDSTPVVVYSSPFYRCIQTIQPFIKENDKRNGKDSSIASIPIHGEPGFGEWYGANRTSDPQPASPKELQSFFPTYSLSYKSICTPASTGESIAELHERAAFTLASIIQNLDNHPEKPGSVLICTHAATFMALSRALTGDCPEDITVQDFHPWTAGLSTFRRRTGVVSREADGERELGTVDWKHGKGIHGGWDCVVDGDCTFLTGGEERGWRFSGKESFSHTVTAHGVDAGTGLGIVTEVGRSFRMDHNTE